jgi:CheY-like chemotaxis protein/HPt (histidine-containing phosphotransfer) domain-containing protein
MSSIASNIIFIVFAILVIVGLIMLLIESRNQKQPLISHGQNKLFRELEIATIITNTKLQVIQINQAACTLFNVTANMALHKSIDTVIGQSLDQLEEYQAPLENSRMLILPMPNQNQPYALHISPIETQPHTEIGWLITFRAIDKHIPSNIEEIAADPSVIQQLQVSFHTTQQLSKYLLSNIHIQNYSQLFQMIYANSYVQQLFLRQLEQHTIGNKLYQNHIIREGIETLIQAQSFHAHNHSVNLAYYISPQVPHSILCHPAELFFLLYQQLSSHIEQQPYTDISIFVDANNTVRSINPNQGAKISANTYEIHFNICQALYGNEHFHLEALKRSPADTDYMLSPRQQQLIEELGASLRHWQSQTQQLTHIKLIAQADDGAAPYYPLSLPTSIRYQNVLVICSQGLARQALIKQLKTWNLIAMSAHNEDDAVQLLSKQTFHLILLATQLYQENDILLKKIQSIPTILLQPIDQIYHPSLTPLNLTSVSMPILTNHLFNAILSVIKEPQQLVSEPTPAPIKPVQVFDNSMAQRCPQTLLIVEDNEINREVLLQLLAQFGYEARTAENGLVALDILRQQQFDTILMDVQMPYMDGLATVRHIRAEFPPDQQPQIIAVTANIVQDDRDECFEAGMNDYINKPIDPQQLVAALERASLHAMHSIKNHTTEASTIMTNTTVAPPQELLNQEALERLYIVLGPQGHNILPSLLKSFQENAEQLYEAADNPDDIETLHRAAHTLKGNSDLFGTVQLTHYCRELERRAKIGDLSEANTLVAQIREAFDQAMISLEQLVDEHIKETANET